MLLEVVRNDKKDQDIVKKRILMYMITRPLPSTKASLSETGISSENLIQMYNYYDGIAETIP